MSDIMQIPAAAQPISISFRPVAAVRAAVVFARAAIARAVAPSHAERHGKDVDIVSVSRLNGHGRDGVAWNDIGYRI